MTLDLTAQAAENSGWLGTVAVIFLVLAVVFLLGVVGAVIARSTETALIAGAMSVMCSLMSGVVIDASKTTSETMSSASEQIEAHYGVEVPEDELREYFNQDASELHEFEIISDNGKLEQYALKESDNKLYLFKKSSEEYTEVKTDS